MKLILALVSFVFVSSAFAANCNWMAKRSALRYVAKNHNERSLTVLSSKRCLDSFSTYLIAIESDVQTHYMQVRVNQNHREATCRVSKVSEIQPYEGIEAAFSAGRCKAIQY